MNKLFRVLSLFAALTASAFAQTALTQTTLAAAVASGGASSIVLTSATGVAVTSATTNGSVIYIIDAGQTQGELDNVTSVTGTTIGVRRGMGGTKSTSHANGARVLIGPPGYFKTRDPQGSCVTAATDATPIVNVNTGNQWLCSTITLTWTPGWQNMSAPAAVNTLVASAAGVVLPSGPLFHINGTAAITGFTIPVGFFSGCFTAIPDAIFTWTAAGNIAVAGTAVVNKALTFCWDATNSKWIPSYIA